MERGKIGDGEGQIDNLKERREIKKTVGEKEEEIEGKLRMEEGREMKRWRDKKGKGRER